MTAPPDAGPPPRRPFIRALAGDAGFLAIALPAVLGVALIVWFACTISKPHQLGMWITTSRYIETASYRGRLWLVLSNEQTRQGYVFGWINPPGAPPRPPPDVLFTMVTAGGQQQLWWFGVSHTLAATVLMLPAMILLTVRLVRRRRHAQQRGFTIQTAP